MTTPCGTVSSRHVSAEIPHGKKHERQYNLPRPEADFATRLRASNVHPYDISFLLGHQIQGITKTYAHESIASLRQAVKALDEPWGEVIQQERVARRKPHPSLIVLSSSDIQAR